MSEYHEEAFCTRTVDWSLSLSAVVGDIMIADSDTVYVLVCLSVCVCVSPYVSPWCHAYNKRS